MIKPVAKWVAITKIVEEVKTSFGMAITPKEASEMRYQKGEVVAVGDEIENLKSGDIILFDDRGSYSMLLDGEWVTFIQYREVVAIF